MDDLPGIPPLPDTARAGDERTTLLEMLEYYRTVLLRKSWGLTDTQLATPVAPSDLTIGGLLLHMALVEDGWFDYKFAGNHNQPHWEAIPWDDDPDWEFHNVTRYTGEQLRSIYADSLARSRAVVDATADLDQLSARNRPSDDAPWNLRWILVHMIEEYARHCGHADYIRQSIDGEIDD